MSLDALRCRRHLFWRRRRSNAYRKGGRARARTRASIRRREACLAMLVCWADSASRLPLRAAACQRSKQQRALSLYCPVGWQLTSPRTSPSIVGSTASRTLPRCASLTPYPLRRRGAPLFLQPRTPRVRPRAKACSTSEWSASPVVVVARVLASRLPRCRDCLGVRVVIASVSVSRH